jgi:DNA modification methylase
VTVTLLRGDALHLPIADHTVDLVVTSPPYFGLRSYQDGGRHYAGQIGSEATPAEWVAAMLAATAEMVRCLKPSGSIWVNLGDRYDSGTTTARTNPGTIKDGAGQGYHVGSPRISLGRAKSLMGLPWRYAIACIDQLGLILRAEVIWNKPNGLPESVTDRVRRSHETWLHFTVQPRYFSAVDEIREPHERSWGGSPNGGHTYGTMKAPGTKDANLPHALPNPLGKLPGSVWSIPSQPLTVPPELGVDHFAAFPMAWPRRLIAGWSPAGICSGCGDGRRPVVDKHPDYHRGNGRMGPQTRRDNIRQGEHTGNIATVPEYRDRVTITGYVCACTPYTDHPGTGERHRNGNHPSGGNAGTNVTAGTRLSDLGLATRVGAWREYHFDQWTPAPTTPAVILDPFGGTGTTALVAHVMGRHGITVDLSADYCRLAAWRCSDPGQLAQAAQVDKPPAQTVGQDTLFEVTG